MLGFTKMRGFCYSICKQFFYQKSKNDASAFLFHFGSNWCIGEVFIVFFYDPCSILSDREKREYSRNDGCLLFSILLLFFFLQSS